MDETKKVFATNVDEFVPSLWHYIGQCQARYTLISLVNQIQNDTIAGRNPEYPLILLTGPVGSGRKTLALSLHFALGNLEFKEVALVLGISEDPAEFFVSSTEYVTYYIPNVVNISPTVAGQLVHVVRDKYYYQSIPGYRTEKIPIGNQLIIISAESNPKINPEFLKYVKIRCDLAPYSVESIYKILRQRVDYLNWDMSEPALHLLAEKSNNNPGTAMKLLQQSYIISRAEDKDKIKTDHAKKALFICGL